MQPILQINAFLKNATSVSGPRFLLQPENEWPVNPEDADQLPADDHEVKKADTVNAAQANKEVNAVTRRIHHFSCFFPSEKVCGLDLEI